MNSKFVSLWTLLSVCMIMITCNSILCTNSTTTPSPPIEFTGRYKLYSNENYDPFLTQLGFNATKRTAIMLADAEYEISHNASTGEYVWKTFAKYGNNEIRFKSGVQFGEGKVYSKSIRSIITVEDNRWVKKQIDGKVGVVDAIYEFSQEGIVVSVTTKGVTAIRRFRRI